MIQPALAQEPLPETSVILAAAGASSRFGGAVRKPFVALKGEPLLLHSLRVFASIKEIGEIVLAVSPEDLAYCREAIWPALEKLGVSMVIEGGACRAETVWQALAVTDPLSAVVAVHDAARPFIKEDTCRALLRLAGERGAAIPVVPCSDSLKRVEGDKITETMPRLGVMRAQTPQCFQRGLLIDAYEYAKNTGGLSAEITDEATVAQSYGKEVSVVLGQSTNIKITQPEDLALAEALAAGEQAAKR